MKWDVFISHASEDKDEFVRDLAATLQERGIRVWYDEEFLKIGDSIRRGIERGLAESRFGVFVFSPYFLQSEWSKKELDFFVSAECDERRRILPLLHKVSISDVQEKFPLLTDRVALSTDEGLEAIVDKIVSAINYEGSLEAVFKGPLEGEQSLQQQVYDELLAGPSDCQHRLKTVRVLYVEDDPGIREDVTLFLAEMVAKCSSVSNGLDALEQLTQHQYDILITDVRMRGMDGLQLFDNARKKYPDLPVVFLTAFPDDVAGLKLRQYAAFVFKPSYESELAKQLVNVLDDRGIFRFSNELFLDGGAAYQQLSEVKTIVRRFLIQYPSGDLFETALRHKIKDAVGDFCDRLERHMCSSQNAKDLVGRVSRIERIMQQIRHGSTNGLRSVVKGIEKDVCSDRRGVTVMVEIPGRLPSLNSVKGAETFLAFCVLELFGNALDAIDGKATLRITFRRMHSRNAVCLSVWNDGPRIPAELATVVWNEGVSTKGAGRGMGLYILKYLSDRLGAEVCLDQSDGVQFSVLLPLGSNGDG